MEHRRGRSERRRKQGRDDGFTLIEVMVATLIIALVMMSLTEVVMNSLLDAANTRLRGTAIDLANQTIEEVRALSWTTVESGLSATDTTLTTAGTDPNVTNQSNTYCFFQGTALDVGGTVGTGTCTPRTWSTPTCTKASTVALPTASALSNGAPLNVHQECYSVASEPGTTYAVDTYVTGAATGTGSTTAPWKVTVVVGWTNSLRAKPGNPIVTTTDISTCPVNSSCN